MAGLYAHAKQFKRMHRRLSKLRTYAGRLVRDTYGKAMNMDEDLAILLDRADRIWNQQPRDKSKLYSLHEPDVQCISKGKTNKRYEFGQKVAVATTIRSIWIVVSALMKGNPHDGHTLSETLTNVERVTGVAISDTYVDNGNHDHSSTERRLT